MSLITDQNPASAFASDFGWPPGHFPSEIPYDGKHYLRREKKFDKEGDLQWVDYDHCGLLLRVFND